LNYYLIMSLIILKYFCHFWPPPSAGLLFAGLFGLAAGGWTASSPLSSSSSLRC